MKIDKLTEKIRNNTRNVSLKDFEALANYFGHIEEGSKHPKVIIGNNILPYKRENPVKSCYVKELLKIIEEQRIKPTKD